MDHFFIIYFILYAITFISIYILLKFLNKERDLYNLFANDKNMQALMANNPKRFHISIVYLMTYMARSDDSNNVQLDKLQIIIRYIKEVIPPKYQRDAIESLKYLTDRIKGNGKNASYESIVNVTKFLTGKDCLNKGNYGYRYKSDLHGKRLAEELAKYMSEDDRLYLMYLLYRLAIADGEITTSGKNSEFQILNRLCVSGLHINKIELDSLIDHFKNGNDQVWYNKHFTNKENFYPSSDVLGDIFRMNLTSISLLDRQVDTVSISKTIKYILIFAPFVLMILLVFFYDYSDDLMTNAYIGFDYIPFIGLILLWILITYIATNIPIVESSIIPIIRTDLENTLQHKAFITSSIIIYSTIFLLFWGVSNILYIYGNKSFANPEPLVITRPITGSRLYHGKNTTYYLDFEEVNLQYYPISTKVKNTYISYINKQCLKTLPYLSGMKFKNIKNSKSLASMNVKSSDFYDHGEIIKLYFKVGYYGLIFYDSYAVE